MQIYPVDREWVFAHVLEPFEQGCELINLFWNGVDLSLERNALSLGDRLIYLIEGALLLISLINTVIWLAYKTFLHMDTLVDPFCLEPEVETLPPPPTPEIFIHRSEEEESAHPSELFGFIETSGGERTQVSWRLEPFSDGVIVNQIAPTFSSTSTYTPEYLLKECHYVEGPKGCDLLRMDSQCTQIHLQTHSGNGSSTNRTFELPVGATWVQQRTVGFRPFVHSNDQEIEFYTVIPEYPMFLNFLLRWFDPAPCIVKLKAKKMGLDEGLLKVEVTSTRGWPYSLFDSTLWFDPANGQLKKFHDRGPWPISERRGTCVQSSR